MSVHPLTVDAYALQHPGKESPQTIHSANVHLASLYSYFELGYPIRKLATVKSVMAQFKDAFVWLEPPKSQKDINVGDVLETSNASQHRKKILKWANYVYRKWGNQHSKAADYLDRVGISKPL